MNNKNINLNKSLVNCINAIIKIGASSKGDQFDETVKDKLRAYIKGAKYISSEQWCSKDKNSIFKNYYKRTLLNCFDFTDLPEIIDNGVKINLMIVNKPNGSQKWPDLLIINNNIGLPIEIKSSKKDGIIWNSGLPKQDGLYIYNCYGKSKTTCFLGQHAINQEELSFLKKLSQEAKKLNQKYNNSNWSYYVRDMFNSNQIFFEDDKIIEKIDENLIKLSKLEIELKEAINNKCDQENINNKQLDIKYLKNKNTDLLNKYNNDKNKRLKIENETLEFLKNLNWK